MSGYWELIKTRCFILFWPVFMLLVSHFGSSCDPNILGTPGSGYGELIKTRSFGLFWPVLYAITYLFWVPLRSKHFGNHENSLFWPILACFVWYYSLILVAATIRMFWEPRDPVTGNSSKLAVLAYSAEFCKNYSLILGPAAIRTFWVPRGPVTGNS